MITSLLSALTVVFLAEMTDSSKALTSSLTKRHKITEISAGISLAIMTLTLLNVSVGRGAAYLFDIETMRLASGLALIALAVNVLSPIQSGIKDKSFKRVSGIPEIFTLFASAEMADKSSVAIIALTAANPSSSLYIFIGAIIGMTIANSIALLEGYIFKKRIGGRAFSVISAATFIIFGGNLVYPSLEYYLYDMAEYVALAVAIFFITALLLLRTKGKNGGCHG